MTRSGRRLRIAQVAPPAERVPPYAYGGTERVVDALVHELVGRGHEVTTFASADSDVPGRLVATVPKALRSAGFDGDQSPYFVSAALEVVRRQSEFDVVHSHLEWMSLLLARALTVPTVSTFHGRLDLPWTGEMFADAPAGLVAISRNQASTRPEVPWAAVIHNGLDLAAMPFERRRSDDLCFVGRVSPEKGLLDAIEIARLSGRRLRIAAKIGNTTPDRAYWEDVVKPALDTADVDFLGEVSEADRNALLASSYASLMPGAWPEPFGLVAIESLASGTPLLARRVGALPEIVRDGVDGFLGDDAAELAFDVDRVGALDRAAIRASVVERFSASAMADRYEELYERMLSERSGVGGGRGDGGPARLPGERAWQRLEDAGDPSRSAALSARPRRSPLSAPIVATRQSFGSVATLTRPFRGDATGAGDRLGAGDGTPPTEEGASGEPAEPVDDRSDGFLDHDRD